MVDAELLPEAADALEALADGRSPDRLQALSGGVVLASLRPENSVGEGLLSRDLSEAAEDFYRVAAGRCWDFEPAARTNALAIAVRKFIGCASRKPTRAQNIEATLQVANQVQADELRAAWHEIVSGQKLTHAEALEEGLEAIMERCSTRSPDH
jgi:hypothetical protein